MTIEEDLSTIYIEDITGVYSVNNEGGYGTPNNDRSAYAGVLYVQYTPYSGVLEYPTFTTNQIFYDNTYENTEKSKFAITYSKDGWYTFVYSLVPTSALAEEGNIYYDTSLDALRYHDGNDWTLLTDFSLLDNLSQFETVKLDRLIDTKLILEYNKLLEEYNNCYFNCDTCKCDEKYESLNKLSIFLKAAQYRFASNKRNLAQQMIEKLTNIYI